MLSWKRVTTVVSFFLGRAAQILRLHYMKKFSLEIFCKGFFVNYFKKLLKFVLPQGIVNYLRSRQVEWQFRDYRGKPLDQTFDKIYASGIWGVSEDPSQVFYSGSGSHDEVVVVPYIQAVSRFLEALETKPDVVDLGCGDFNVGSQLRGYCNGYVACDVVEKLIRFNQEKYSELGVDFRVLNMVEDDLPKGDVVFIRQVLQHLSNSEISSVLQKIKARYKCLILTEHLPSTCDFHANVDKPSGPDIRTGLGSGVVITRPPFNFKASREELICSVPEGGGVIETRLYFID